VPVLGRNRHLSGTAQLTIDSRNFGAWSLRGWLLCRLARIDFCERLVAGGDTATTAPARAWSESSVTSQPSGPSLSSLPSPSSPLPPVVPSLEHEGVVVWDTLAIAEYLRETVPGSALLPDDPIERARCRSVSAQAHTAFDHLRAALPMNVRARYRGFKLWAGARADVDRVVALWQDCLRSSGGPFLFGKGPTIADAMFAPECSRMVTYDVDLPDDCQAYVEEVMGMPEMAEWTAAAADEPARSGELEELDAEF